MTTAATTALDPSFCASLQQSRGDAEFLAMGEPAFLAEKKHVDSSPYLHEHPEFVVDKTLRRILYYWTGYWSFSLRPGIAGRSPTSRAISFTSAA